MQCSYSLRWWLHGKLWCRGARWDTCRVLVQTSRGAEHRAEGERVAIRDNPWARTFTVTMRQLRPDDADTYWCGITEAGSDRSVRVTVAVDPGKSFLGGCPSHYPRQERLRVQERVSERIGAVSLPRIYLDFWAARNRD